MRLGDEDDPLTRGQRAVFDAHLEGLSMRRIAIRLDTSTNSVKVMLSKARKRLGIKAVGKGGHPPPPDIPPDRMPEYRFFRRQGLDRIEVREAMGIPMVDTIAIIKGEDN